MLFFSIITLFKANFFLQLFVFIRFLFSELACTPSGVLVNAKNVRKVCKKISHSLSDKTSQNKGACMFRKRTKRAEKFAIVGYGKQSVEESTSVRENAG